MTPLSFIDRLARHPRLTGWLAFGLLLAAFHYIFSRFFPIAGFRLGHDYAYVFPGLLDGLYWFVNNGFSIPWFTPSFCAGQAFFADPQSAYYALPQLIALVADPLTAVYASLLVFSSLIYWGGYLLMRKIYLTEQSTAIMVGGLLMFNGFLPQRMIVGHTSYLSFALVPWIALLLLVPTRSRWQSTAAALAAGTMLAYEVHSGLGTLLLAAALAIVPLALLVLENREAILRVGTRTTIAILFAAGLSAAKLVAAFSLLGNLPRDFYPLPGAANPGDAILMILAGLFLPSQAAYQIGSPRLVNQMWAVAPHEWAYGFGIAAAMLSVILVLHSLRRKSFRWPSSPTEWMRLAAMLIVLWWPVVFSTWQTDWHAFLKTVPLLKSTSFPFRWTIVYIPIIAVALGLLLDRSGWSFRRRYIAGACLVATVGLTFIEPRSYYMQQPYDIRPVTIAYHQAIAHPGEARILELGTQATLRSGDYESVVGLNDTLIAGVSQIYCYNPIFGYRLEKFSAEGLRPGGIMAATDGKLNLKNPACYVFPKENDCQPGDLFRADQLDAARAFAEYRPFPFRFSPAQEWANAVTRATIVAGLAFPFVWLIGLALRHFIRRPEQR
jgi:hypothetical protein